MPFDQKFLRKLDSNVASVLEGASENLEASVRKNYVWFWQHIFRWTVAWAKKEGGDARDALNAIIDRLDWGTAIEGHLGPAEFLVHYIRETPDAAAPLGALADFVERLTASPRAEAEVMEARASEEELIVQLGPKLDKFLRGEHVKQLLEEGIPVDLEEVGALDGEALANILANVDVVQSMADRGIPDAKAFLERYEHWIVGLSRLKATWMKAQVSEEVRAAEDKAAELRKQLSALKRKVEATPVIVIPGEEDLIRRVVAVETTVSRGVREGWIPPKESAYPALRALDAFITSKRLVAEKRLDPDEAASRIRMALDNAEEQLKLYAAKATLVEGVVGRSELDALRLENTLRAEILRIGETVGAQTAKLSEQVAELARKVEETPQRPVIRVEKPPPAPPPQKLSDILPVDTGEQYRAAPINVQLSPVAVEDPITKELFYPWTREVEEVFRRVPNFPQDRYYWRLSAETKRQGLSPVASHKMYPDICDYIFYMVVFGDEYQRPFMGVDEFIAHGIPEAFVRRCIEAKKAMRELMTR